MSDRRDAQAPRVGPKLVLTDSFMKAAQAGCDAADRLRGGVEVPWAHYGRWMIADGDRFGAIYLTHPFILKAECGTSWFRVKPEDLSALGRSVFSTHPHLTVLGQTHRHPGLFKPTPSYTDDGDREKMANLLRACAEREVVEEWEVPPDVPPVDAAGDAKRIVKYSIDPRLVISIWPRATSGLRSSILPVSVRRIAQAATLMCTRRVGLSYQVYLVLNAKADRDAIYAQVMEFRRLPFGEDVSTLFDDWPVEILPDAEVAARLGLDVDLVRCDVDPDRIETTVEECVQPYYRGTAHTYPVSYWSSGGGSNGVSRYRDPYEAEDIDSRWDKGRSDG